MKQMALFRYLQTRKKRKLYKQWMDKAELSPEAIPSESVEEEVVPEMDNNQSRLRLLYIFLGVSFAILCTGIILLIVQSC